MKRWRILSLVFLLIVVIAFALRSLCITNILAANGSVGLLRMTTKAGMKLNRACHGSYPIIEAVKSRQAEMVKFLLANKVDVNVRDQESAATPLIWAAKNGDADTAKELIAAGAEVNSGDSIGSTPLHYAVRNRATGIPEMLINAGANVNTPDGSGDTPLMEAAQAGNLELVRLLLKNGAEKISRNKSGHSAFDFSFGRRDPELSQLLEAVYFVPIGDAPTLEINALVGHYREKFGIEIGILPTLALSSSDVDTGRQQLIAENLVESMRRAHAEYVGNNSVILVGITRQDIYPKGQNFQFCFGWRVLASRAAVVSTARMDLHYPGEPASEAVLAKRLAKVITKDIGIMFFGKAPNNNPRSVLYDGILGIEELDQVTEDF